MLIKERWAEEIAESFNWAGSSLTANKILLKRVALKAFEMFKERVVDLVVIDDEARMQIENLGEYEEINLEDI